ncbi:MAG: NifB/NifX family molybdenum-iron cluster-binding protein [Aigarchaeota archaeon]|nr:NifB/NifX family molybdenum-iron cluster-binding protein [Aigarchaeota archaeon]
MKTLRIAVATKGQKRLEDEVSEVFGRTKTITIIDTEDGEVKNVEVMQNPAASYRFGAGPILVKTLVDMKIDTVVAAELGPGASALVTDHRITKVTVKPGIRVDEAIRTVQLQHS